MQQQQQIKVQNFNLDQGIDDEQLEAPVA